MLYQLSYAPERRIRYRHRFDGRKSYLAFAPSDNDIYQFFYSGFIILVTNRDSSALTIRIWYCVGATTTCPRANDRNPRF